VGEEAGPVSGKLLLGLAIATLCCLLGYELLKAF
jgi:hypothetical protein